jgi:hypothetical protein
LFEADITKIVKPSYLHWHEKTLLLCQLACQSVCRTRVLQAWPLMFRKRRDPDLFADAHVHVSLRGWPVPCVHRLLPM